MFKLIQYNILRFLATQILKKYHPEIIAITGSLGKTSTKEACFNVLRTKFNVLCTPKNYGTEIGVPSTIIGVKVDKAEGIWRYLKLVSWWLLIFGRALCLLICRWRGYPQILVLELAADKPGDIEYFLDFIKPKMGVLTSISQVHLANYSKFSQLIAEKRKLITALPREGYAVLNFDDELIVRTADKTKGRIISYGINNSEAEIRALEVKITQKDEVIGLSFKLSYQGTVTPVFISRFVSLPQVSSLLAAAAVGVIYGLTPLEITQSLEKLKPLPGRFELKEGLNNLLVIDDTYNAAPVSTCGALESLITLPLGKRKIAVLGDMLELGSFTEEGHRTVGKRAAEFKIDLLLTLGEKARIISETAELCGLKKVKHFDNKKELIDFLRSELKPEDVVLVKGSRKMKMDEVVDGILTE